MAEAFDSKAGTRPWATQVVLEHLDSVTLTARDRLPQDLADTLTKLVGRASAQAENDAVLARQTPRHVTSPTLTFVVSPPSKALKLPDGHTDRLIEMGWIVVRHFDRKTWWRFAVPA